LTGRRPWPDPSVADPHHFDADPDTFDADPDPDPAFITLIRIGILPTFHSDADPDPTFQFDPDPNPTTHFFPDLNPPML
jgi:hypothetical protein